MKQTRFFLSALIVMLCLAAGTTAQAKDFTNSIGMEMVWVEPLKCWVGKYETLQAEYEKVTGQNPSNFKGPRRPVEMVAWVEAMAFCSKLTQVEAASGKLPPGTHYTLPTDAQWDVFVGDAKLEDAVTSLEPQKHEATENAGSKGANNFGLYDVRGNVSEWCADWYDSAIFAKDSNSGKSVDYVVQKYRVLRGGSWGNTFANNLAVSYRFNGFTSYNSTNYIGFRMVLVGGSGD